MRLSLVRLTQAHPFGAPLPRSALEGLQLIANLPPGAHVRLGQPRVILSVDRQQIHRITLALFTRGPLVPACVFVCVRVSVPAQAVRTAPQRENPKVTFEHSTCFTET